LSKRHPDFDYEEAGLLSDVFDDAGRDARVRLLDYLIDEELVDPDEIVQAHAEKRLFLLPIERALGGTPKYTASEVAERAGIDIELFLELRKSLGLAEPDRDQVYFSEFDVKTMRSVRANLEMGMSLESIREINRVLGGALSQLAVVVERQFLATYLDPTLDEAEMAQRYAAITRATTPEFAFVLQHLFNLHLRDELRADILGNEAAIDFLDGTREMAVCFADLVGFTSLGQQIPADELGEIAERFNSIAAGVVRPPVRLVKTIGDAVMLASTSPGELLETVLELMDAVEAEGDAFPELSVGVAYGTAVERGGDVYGPPVNLASRLCDVARAGAILATDTLREAFRDEYDWSSAGRRRFKGIDAPVAGYRLRRKGARGKSKQRS
jgi:adenylate cyclase